MTELILLCLQILGVLSIFYSCYSAGKLYGRAKTFYTRVKNMLDWYESRPLLEGKMTVGVWDNSPARATAENVIEFPKTEEQKELEETVTRNDKKKPFWEDIDQLRAEQNRIASGSSGEMNADDLDYARSIAEAIADMEDGLTSTPAA